MKTPGTISKTSQLPDEFGRHFALEELHDDRDGLRILLRARTRRLLWVSFEIALAVRYSDEGDYPELSEMFGTAESGLAILEGSSWADEFAEFGSQLIRRDQFTHWAIGASNYIVEVLAAVEPRISLVEPTQIRADASPDADSFATFEVVGDTQLAISGSAAALRALAQRLSHVADTMEPVSLVTESWGGKGLGEEPTGQGTSVVNRVTLRALSKVPARKPVSDG